MVEIIKKLWNVAWDMWEQRNKELHKLAQNREDILEKDTNKKIRQTYAIRPSQLARVAQFTKKPNQTPTQSPTDNQATVARVNCSSNTTEKTT